MEVASSGASQSYSGEILAAVSALGPGIWTSVSDRDRADVAMALVKVLDDGSAEPYSGSACTEQGSTEQRKRPLRKRHEP